MFIPQMIGDEAVSPGAGCWWNRYVLAENVPSDTTNGSVVAISGAGADERVFEDVGAARSA